MNPCSGEPTGAWVTLQRRNLTKAAIGTESHLHPPWIEIIISVSPLSYFNDFILLSDLTPNCQVSLWPFGQQNYIAAHQKGLGFFCAVLHPNKQLKQHQWWDQLHLSPVLLTPQWPQRCSSASTTCEIAHGTEAMLKAWWSVETVQETMVG